VAHLHESQYVSILEATPEAERSVLTTLLYSPVQTMASLAQPHFIRVNATTTCASLKRELEARDDESTPPIYVVGSDSRLLGTVSPLTVIASRNAGLILQDVMSIVEPIAGQVPVAAAVDAIQWRDHPVLPVVDVDFHLLGAVTREQLENANDGKVHEHYGLEEVLQIAAMGYIDVCAQLLDITIGGAERESH
jgi:Mg/Co/Ni transporter MgtE